MTILVEIEMDKVYDTSILATVDGIPWAFRSDVEQ